MGALEVVALLLGGAGAGSFINQFFEGRREERRWKRELEQHKLDRQEEAKAALRAQARAFHSAVGSVIQSGLTIDLVNVQIGPLMDTMRDALNALYDLEVSAPAEVREAAREAWERSFKVALLTLKGHAAARTEAEKDQAGAMPKFRRAVREKLGVELA